MEEKFAKDINEGPGEEHKEEKFAKEKPKGSGGEKEPVKEKFAKETDDIVPVQRSELRAVGPPIGFSPTIATWLPALQSELQTTYYLAWSPTMAVRVKEQYGNLVPCRLFRSLACFNVLSPGTPYVPLYKNKREAAVLYKELKALKRNPTVIDDDDKACEDHGDACEPESPHSDRTRASARSAGPKAASAVRRASRGEDRNLANVRNEAHVRTALEMASQSANDAMTQYKITFSPAYLLQKLLDTKWSVAPLKSFTNEHAPAPFAPGHLQVQGDFFLADIKTGHYDCQRVQVTEGPISVIGSKRAAEETFAEGSRQAQELRQQQRTCKRARLFAGIQQSKELVARMTANMNKMQEAMRKIDTGGDDSEGVADLL